MLVSYVTEVIATQSTKSRHVTNRKLGKYLKSLVIFHYDVSKQCDAYNPYLNTGRHEIAER